MKNQYGIFLRALATVFLVLQVLRLPGIVNHRSDAPNVLGRYSYDYFALLVLTVGIVFTTLSTVYLANRIVSFWDHRPLWQHDIVLASIFVLMLGVSYQNIAKYSFFKQTAVLFFLVQILFVSQSIVRRARNGVESRPRQFLNLAYSTSAIVLSSASFVLVSTLWPLYVSNQNTYFLHGLADSTLPSLKTDWLVNRQDPYPIFSFLVKSTTMYLSESMFYIYLIVLVLLTFLSLWAISANVFEMHRRQHRYIFLGLGIVLLQSGWLTSIGVRIDNPMSGVASQRLIDPSLQPSTFGVFLLVSIWLYLENRIVVSVMALMVAPLIHASFVLPSAVLTLIYMLDQYRSRHRLKEPFMVGLLALLLISPALIITYSFQFSVDRGMAQEGRDILVYIRFPQHSDPDVWLSHALDYRLIIMLIAIFLARHSRLFLVLVVLSLSAVILTVAQILLDSSTLALIRPWRISVIVYPISFAVVVGLLVQTLACWLSHLPILMSKYSSVLAIASVIFLGQYGYSQTMNHQNVFNTVNTISLMKQVKSLQLESPTFLVPILFDRFRLYTGQPIFIDWKSHPYRGDEVVEWYERVQLAEEFYASGGDEQCQAIPRWVQQFQITHVVVDKQTSSEIESCKYVDSIYQDEHYAVFAVRAAIF